MGAWTAEIKQRNPTVSAKLINGIESWLISCYPAPKKNMYLEGNYAPIAESGPLTDLPLKGVLPAAVDGEFVRNGPNPHFTPTRGYHWFDGDGMLHGVRIKNGKATYVSRLVKTNRLMQEIAQGRALFGKLGDMEGVYGLLSLMVIDPLRNLLGVISKKKGAGTGNTALVFHDRRLLALNEGDHPYVIRVIQDGELETLGRWSYEGSLTHSFTAHPKLDAETGEMFGFGYNATKAPYVTYRKVSSEGKMGPPVSITIRKPIMMHDFAITEQYAVFLDLPLVFYPKDIVKEKRVFRFDDTMPARFGVLPRSADSEAAIRWFELPACMIFHTANAWEEGDEVVLFACRLPTIQLTNLQDSSAPPSVENFMYEFRFNMKTGEASQREMANINCDFPRINEAFVGRKQRYAYGAHLDSTVGLGIIKYDFTGKPVKVDPKKPAGSPGTALAGYISFGPGRFGGEPVFVPADRDGSEDDGYLLTFVYDSSTDKSEMVVYDAKTMAAEPVAVVLLPTRVPFGFHGLFVNEAQLQSQRTAL